MQCVSATECMLVHAIAHKRVQAVDVCARGVPWDACVRMHMCERAYVHLRVHLGACGCLRLDAACECTCMNACVFMVHVKVCAPCACDCASDCKCECPHSGCAHDCACVDGHVCMNVYATVSSVNAHAHVYV